MKYPIPGSAKAGMRCAAKSFGLTEYAIGCPEVDRYSGSREVGDAMRVIASTLCLSIAAMPATVFAADPPAAPPPAAPAPSAEEAPKVQQIRAVERGAFIE